MYYTIFKFEGSAYFNEFETKEELLTYINNEVKTNIDEGSNVMDFVDREGEMYDNEMLIIKGSKTIIPKVDTKPIITIDEEEEN